MRVRFLLDENLPPYLKSALVRHDAPIDVLRVGEEGAPPLATPDPEILLYLEQTQRALVTNNRASMPEHLAAHVRAGRRHWGILMTSRELRVRGLAEAVYIIWGASEAEEWLDRIYWIPF